MKKFIKFLPLLFLLMVNIFSHWYVFFDHNILLTGDWTYFFPKQIIEFSTFHLYNGFYNFGGIYPFPGNSVYYRVYSFLYSFGIGYDSCVRIIFILPIMVLTPLFSYICFNKLLKNHNVAFFAACLYTFNSFFLKIQTDFLTWAFAWWILPALILSIITYLESGRSKYLLINTLLTFIVIAFEIRFAILILVFSGIFIGFEVLTSKLILKGKIFKLTFLFCSLGMGGLLHLYWILPMLFTNISSSIFNYASPTPFVSFYAIKDVFSLRSYQWSKNYVLEPFIRQPFEWQNYLTILIVFIGIAVKKGKLVIGQSRFVFLIASLTILIFIGKQELLPFPEIYGWLFYHIPLFNLYRESSKFFILISFCVSIFFGIGMFNIYEIIKSVSKRWAIFAVALLLFCTTLFNLQHFFDQKVGGMTKGITEPANYAELEKYLSQDSSFYRILWLPTRPEFGYNSNIHPGVNATDLTTIYKNKTDFTLFDGNGLIQQQIVYLLNQAYSNDLLNAGAVRYIIVPDAEVRNVGLSASKSESVYKYFEFYGPREFYISYLDNLPYLKRVKIGNSNLAIYENIGHSSHIYSSNPTEVIYESNKPTEYRVSLSSLIVNKLNFSETYNENWILIKPNCGWLDLLIKKDFCIIPAIHARDNFDLNTFNTVSGYFPSVFSIYYRPSVYVYLGVIFSGLIFATYLLFLYLVEKMKC